MKTSLLNHLFARLAGLLLLAVMSFLLSGCTESESERQSETVSITGLKLPAAIDVLPGGVVTLTGNGFKSGDVIVMESPTISDLKYAVPTSEVSASTVSFVMPLDFSQGKFRLFVSRGKIKRLLGTTTINIQTDVPDQAGMNIKGKILSAGQPVAGVVVSDGYVLTRTDAEGIYYLKSDKANGYVFISVPGGYEVPVVETIPQFFKYLNQSASVMEQKDFVLTARPNDKHKLVVFTDVHLANRVSDLRQFRAGFLAEVTALVRDAATQDLPVYGLSLGDLSWDTYWYTNNYNLKNYLQDTKSLGFPIYNVQGNHDNDPNVNSNDFAASAPYRQILGPNYYSFNLGKVHYIQLDNVEYSNPGGGQDPYTVKITAEKMEWLKLDLATVEKSTPIILGMHVPLHATPSLDAGGRPTMNYSGLVNAADLVKCFDGYTNVNIVSGHTHVNFNVMRSANLREHNVAAVCATWWWTGHTNYANNHISRDGSPGAYKIFDLDGTQVKWHFKGIGERADYQFRAYDLNRCQVTADKYCPGVSAADVKSYGGGYDVANNSNEVLVNVFDWAEDWTIQIKDLVTNSNLQVTRVRQMDPLHVISYNMKKLANNAKSAMTFPTSNTAHLFKAKASSPTSSVEVTVTDGFGNLFTETMTRPKELTISSK